MPFSALPVSPDSSPGPIDLSHPDDYHVVTKHLFHKRDITHLPEAREVKCVGHKFHERDVMSLSGREVRGLMKARVKEEEEETMNAPKANMQPTHRLMLAATEEGDFLEVVGDCAQQASGSGLHSARVMSSSISSRGSGASTGSLKRKDVGGKSLAKGDGHPPKKARSVGAGEGSKRNTDVGLKEKDTRHTQKRDDISGDRRRPLSEHDEHLGPSSAEQRESGGGERERATDAGGGGGGNRGGNRGGNGGNDGNGGGGGGGDDNDDDDGGDDESEDGDNDHNDAGRDRDRNNEDENDGRRGGGDDGKSLDRSGSPDDRPDGEGHGTDDDSEDDALSSCPSSSSSGSNFLQGNQHRRQADLDEAYYGAIERRLRHYRTREIRIVDEILGVRYSTLNTDTSHQASLRFKEVLISATIPRGTKTKRAWHQAINAQRLILMLTLNHLKPDITNGQMRIFFRHNPYFAEAWKPLIQRKDGMAARFFRRSWDPRVHASIRFFPNISCDRVSLSKFCSLCTRSNNDATSYEDLKLYGTTYDRLTYKVVGRPEHQIYAAGNNCAQTFKDAHCAEHIVWHVYHDLLRTTFEPVIVGLFDRDPAIFSEEGEDHVSVDMIITRILEGDEDILETAVSRIYDRLDLLSQRRLEPHNLNRNARFAFMDDLVREVDRWEA